MFYLRVRYKQVQAKVEYLILINLIVFVEKICSFGLYWQNISVNVFISGNVILSATNDNLHNLRVTCS